MVRSWQVLAYASTSDAAWPLNPRGRLLKSLKSIRPPSEEGGAPDALESLLVSPHTPRTQAGIAELQGRLTEALGRLSAEHRAVVTMFDIQGMAHAEIGKILGVSEGTVRSRLFYAHRQLQGFLSDLHMEGATV